MDCKKVEKLSNSKRAFQESVCHHLRYSLGQDWQKASNRDLYWAASLAIRDRLIDKMAETEARYEEADAKRCYYLSLEFLMGRSLGNNLYNLGLFDRFKDAMTEIGVDLEEVRESEVDAALGNGGLGRLAACFLDSMATMGLPGYGYGINYEFGLFKQKIDNGYQREQPDNWLANGTPWEIERPEQTCLVPVYGRIEHGVDLEGNYNPMWMDWRVLIGVPHDMPIVGYGGRTVNYLRLYSACSTDEFDMEIFNEGDYIKAVEQKMYSETVSKVLYPSDIMAVGKELRLIQEYFFVACALRDIVNQYLKNRDTFEAFPDKVAIQLNDTHPALAVAELMRVLVDENYLPWDQAWDITTRTVAYTNHTLLSEALEKWPVRLLERVLPRHLQIIYEINHRFLQYVGRIYPGDNARQARLSIIEEGHPKQVRMAHLAIVGSHSVNGVAALHTDLIKSSLIPDFNELWPEKINNKTNGITQRRWLLKSNPMLSDLITAKIGKAWITNLYKLQDLEKFADDADFQADFLKVKLANKQRLAEVIKATAHISVDPASLFDIQTKRIHEYKRQLLNIMHVIHEYLAMVEDGVMPIVPRTYILAGKAAPGYWAAKQIIKLANAVGRVINSDPQVKGLIKVAFVPDYRVSLAEIIIPAADLSEQISTAGKEASGTGNMKFSLNGALTIGTLDGANIEIKEEVGEDNIFIFGLTADEIQQMRERGTYVPWDYYQNDMNIRRVMDSLKSNRFCPDESGIFGWIYDSILHNGDNYFHLADLESYIQAHEQAGALFKTPDLWARKAILNVARIGKFSSDRTIDQYAKEIWNIKSC